MSIELTDIEILQSCDIEGCDSHLRGVVDQSNILWKMSETHHQRPLLCRLGIHRHWRKRNLKVSARQCCRCGYTWKYFED